MGDSATDQEVLPSQERNNDTSDFGNMEGTEPKVGRHGRKLKKCVEEME